MNIRESLRDGIKEGDWSKVCYFYQNMFGENIAPPTSLDNEDPKIPAVAEALREIIELIDPRSVPEKSLPPVNIPDVSEEKQEQELAEITEEYEGVDFVENEIEESSDPIATEFIPSSEFVLPEDDVKGYSEGIQDHMKNRRRNVREAYEPQMRQCQVCGKEFDFNKEYPAGILERQSKIKCNKCRTSSG